MSNPNGLIIVRSADIASGRGSEAERMASQGKPLLQCFVTTAEKKVEVRVKVICSRM